MHDKLDTLIRDLIKKHAFNKQDDLVKALKNQGIETKQSTVSRALRRLGAVKRVGHDGTISYRIAPPGLGNIRGYAGLVETIGHNEGIVVLVTRSGSAGHVAQFIDEQMFDEILGTLAGDNCIFITAKSINQTHKLAKKLGALFPKAVQDFV